MAKIINSYRDDVANLITGSAQYTIPASSLSVNWTQTDLQAAQFEFQEQLQAGVDITGEYENNYPSYYPREIDSVDENGVSNYYPEPDPSAVGTPNPNASTSHKIKLSIFNRANRFIGNFLLKSGKDFYLKNGDLYLRPNELLDRQNISKGNYRLQYDFIYRFQERPTEGDQVNHFFIKEISQTRKEIRLLRNNPDNFSIVEYYNEIVNHLNETNIQYTSLTEAVDVSDDYAFNSFIELPFGRYIPINGYAIDTITDDTESLIVRLETALPTNIQELFHNFHLTNKFLPSQTQDIIFRDETDLANRDKYLPIDTSYIQESDNVVDNYNNYNILTGSLGNDLISEFQQKKDINLNIDYTKFSNHTFFGSVKRKIENFKHKAVKLEGIYSQLSSSLSITSSADIVGYRQHLLREARKVKETFTAYERFLYNDNQETTPLSAPGLGVNKAGNKFDNSLSDADGATTLTLQNYQGFDLVHKKSTDNTVYNHVFTDVYNAEEPPFFNTNKDVYLSFIARGKDTNAPSASIGLEISGGAANVQFGVDTYYGYDFKRTRLIPYEAYQSGSDFEFSKIQNPMLTGSEYRRFIFKGKQNNWRPTRNSLIDADIFNMDTGTALEEGNANFWSGSNLRYYEILSGSDQVFSSSISGSIGDGFAYGIKDSSGQHTPYLFPLFKDDNNLSTTFIYQTSSVLPQGDLFPVFVNRNDKKYGIMSDEVIFTDVKVSYNDPSNIHPFSQIYRPPSGSYAGSTEWNNWYTGVIESASLYDTNNIHSLVNNLPMPLRTEDEHEVLRAYVDMLAEQFDLLRNYIDNYHNFYRLGYSNPNSIPDNLLPIIGDSLGWKLLNPFSSSLADYASSNVEEGGVQSMISQTWKKILNNIIYVYKVKGSTESIKSLLNLYGFDGTGFKMREYGGSTAEHNPTIITNDSADFLEGIKNVKGNVSFVQEIQPFPMMNFRGTNSLGINWWRDNVDANGIEFVFNAEKSGIPQTILRSSGSSNDLWDVRVVPSGSSKDISQVQFRLNYSNSGSSAISTNAISMSSAYSANFTSGSIWNFFLQRNIVTGSSPHNQFTQSYHMFLARKDDDKIKEVNHISMSSDQLNVNSAKYANYNFVNQDQSKASNNLFVGESLSGSLSELRVWNSYVSMSKFKQHTINYQSIVGNKITSSVDDLIYRYKFDENIVNWSKTPNSESLYLHDANSQKVQDHSILIASQDNFNYKTTMTEQTFYKLTVKGTDSMPNDNQTNLAPIMSTTGQLNPNQDIVDEPKDSSGQQERQYSNKFGRQMSYVNAIDSLIMNQLPDFRIDDFIGDPDEDLTDTYEDLMKLRKALIGDTRVSIDIGANIKSAEGLLNNTVVDTLNSITPAKTKFEMSYDIKNDTLFRSKIGRKLKLQPQLNPNKAVGVIDADKFDEPTVISKANENVKTAFIDADKFDEPTVVSFVNNNVKEGKIDADQWDEPNVVSFANDKVKTGNIDADQWDEPKISGNYNNITGDSDKINFVNLSNSIREPYLDAVPEKMNEFFLGGKNHIAKNAGTASNNRFFKSGNPGVHGDYNTYKFESRFTFKTIGDTERFHNSASHHDVFRSFRNRHFINQKQGLTYTSLFGDDGRGTVDGRMVGRTKFFLTDSDGNITYPSNHYINARTSKDRLLRLTYLGTQHNGSNPTKDPIDRDPTPKVPAYTIRVGGADTVQRIKVERPISKNITEMRLRLDGVATEIKFELFKRNKLILTQNLHSTNQGGLNRIENLKFNLIGAVGDYNFKITPITAARRIRGARIIRRTVNNKLVRNASINTRLVGRVREGRFTAIKGPFTMRILVQ